MDRYCSRVQPAENLDRLALQTVLRYDRVFNQSRGRLDMRSPRTSRITIGQVMVVIAVIACLLTFPRLVGSREVVVLGGLAWAVGVFALLNLLVGTLIGIPCPSCTRWSLRRLVRHRNYYRCTACRARFKRFGFGPFLDASGSEDAGRYRKPTVAGLWIGFKPPDDADLARSTSGLLLRHKRLHDPVKESRRRTSQSHSQADVAVATRKVVRALGHLRMLRAIDEESPSREPTDASS
jgi:hypothetical protein